MIKDRALAATEFATRPDGHPIGVEEGVEGLEVTRGTALDLAEIEAKLTSPLNRKRFKLLSTEDAANMLSRGMVELKTS